MRSYEEILGDINFHYHSPEEYRKIHKELRHYNDGIRFAARYPYFPLYFSAACSIVAVFVALSMFI